MNSVSSVMNEQLFNPPPQLGESKNILVHTEWALRNMDYIPIVSTSSGAVRIGLGALQTIGSLFLLIHDLADTLIVVAGKVKRQVCDMTRDIQELFSSTKSESYHSNSEEKPSKELSVKVASYILLHGLGNIVRGSVASIPLLGNAALMTFDEILPEYGIDLRMKYEKENSPPTIASGIKCLARSFREKI